MAINSFTCFSNPTTLKKESIYWILTTIVIVHTSFLKETPYKACAFIRLAAPQNQLENGACFDGGQLLGHVVTAPWYFVDNYCCTNGI